MIRPTTEMPRQFSQRGHLRSALYVLFLLLLSMSLAQRGTAQGVKFTSPVTYPAGHPYVVASGDFNGDGRMDLALSGGNNDIDILLGNGNGTFQNPQNYIFPEVPAVLAAGDFNGDGRIDLIVALRMAKTVNVFLGKGDGTFQTPI